MTDKYNHEDDENDEEYKSKSTFSSQDTQSFPVVAIDRGENHYHRTISEYGHVIAESKATIDSYEDALQTANFEVDPKNWQRAREGLTSLRPQLPKNRSDGKQLDRRIRRILSETRKP